MYILQFFNNTNKITKFKLIKHRFYDHVWLTGKSRAMSGDWLTLHNISLNKVTLQINIKTIT